MHHTPMTSMDASTSSSQGLNPMTSAELGASPISISISARPRNRRRCPSWMRLLVVGVVIGAIEYGPVVSLASLLEIKWQAFDAALESGGLGAGLAAAVAVAIVFAAIAGALVCGLAPAAAGSGIDKIIEFLGGSSHVGGDPALFSARTVGVKLVAIIPTLVAGVAVGREGPAVHIGAGLALLVLRLLPPSGAGDDDLHDAIVIGGAAGFASTFRAPIGALLYAQEELSQRWSADIAAQGMLCAATAAFVIGALQRGNGDQVDFSSIVVFDDEHELFENTWRYADCPGFLFLAVATGALAAAGTKAAVAVRTYRAAQQRPATVRVAECAAVAAVTAAVFVLLPAVYPNCKAVPDSPDDGGHDATHAPRRFVQYTCGEGRYSPLASLALVGEEGAIRHLFARDRIVDLDPLAALLFYVAYSLCAVAILGTAVPAGIFVPNMMLGATAGRFVGAVVSLAAGGDKYVSDAGVYAMLGAAGALAGFTRASVAIVVLLVEITGDVGLMAPLAAVVVVARYVSSAIQPTGYFHSAVQRWRVATPMRTPPRSPRLLGPGESL